MRLLKFTLLLLLVCSGFSAEAGSARIKKVLPFFLDEKGLHTLSPSLYERDAYQAHLRKNPKLRSALRFDVQWKVTKGDNLKLRVELRSSKENTILLKTLDVPVAKTGWFSKWTSFKVEGKDYTQFGDLIAWRATLWDGETKLAEEKSFLW